MQQGARYQAILELLNEIFKDEKPADGIINEYLRLRKYIGSKDRRFITDEIWRIIRQRMRLTFEAGSESPRRVLLWAIKDKLDEVFDGSPYGISQLTEEEKIWLKTPNETAYPDYVEAECPEWLYKKIKDMGLCKSLNEPAEADFRVNFCSVNEVQKRLQQEGLEVKAMPYSPYGLRSHQRISLGNCVAYQEGIIEVQDEASQIASILCDVCSEHKIMDYCCGAGGKSLMLAHLLNNRGHILAHDISSKRLEAIKPRMQRLGVKNIELTDFVATSDCDFDRFIIDAPCSGTGTWRRSPDAKFRLTEEKLKSLTKTQSHLLDYAAEKVKLGGRIVYITCSILADEDENVVEDFLQKHKGFETVDIKALWKKYFEQPYPYSSDKYLKMTPLSTGTDGFFITVLEKKSN